MRKYLCLRCCVRVSLVENSKQNQKKKRNEEWNELAQNKNVCLSCSLFLFLLPFLRLTSQAIWCMSHWFRSEIVLAFG